MLSDAGLFFEDDILDSLLFIEGSESQPELLDPAYFQYVIRIGADLGYRP